VTGLAAYAGQWDLGLALTDVLGAQGARRKQRTYGSRRSYPDDQYQRVHQAHTAYLAERAAETAVVLLRRCCASSLNQRARGSSHRRRTK